MAFEIHIPSHSHRLRLMKDATYSIAPVITDAVGPTTFALNYGTLPPGLVFDTNTGIISGIPTTPSVDDPDFESGRPMPLQIVAVDGVGSSKEVAYSETFFIEIFGYSLNNSFYAGATENGNTNNQTSRILNLTVGREFQYNINLPSFTGISTEIVGTAPPGLFLSNNLGGSGSVNLVGKPTGAGFGNVYNFSVRVNYAFGGYYDFDFTLTVNRRFEYTTIPKGSTSAGLETLSTVTWNPTIGGYPTGTYSASNLPTGLTINPTTGVITGTVSESNVPSTGNRVSIKNTSITFTYADSGTKTVIFYANIPVYHHAQFCIGGYGAPQNYEVAKGGTFLGPIPFVYHQPGTPTGGWEWSIVGTLPAGLSLNPTTGRITGTISPSYSGPTNVFFRYQYASGPTAVQGDFLFFTILEKPSSVSSQNRWGFVGSSGLTISPIVSGGGNYSTSLAEGEVPSTNDSRFVFSIDSGSIPTGMQFSTRWGTVYGSPTVPGAYTYRIKATDKTGAETISGDYRIHVMRVTYPSWPAVIKANTTYTFTPVVEGPFSSSYHFQNTPTGVTNIFTSGGIVISTINHATGVITVNVPSNRLEDMENFDSIPDHADTLPYGQFGLGGAFTQLKDPAYEFNSVAVTAPGSRDGLGNIFVEINLPGVFVAPVAAFDYPDTPYSVPKAQPMLIEGDVVNMTPPFTFAITEASIPQDATPGRYNGMYVDPTFFEITDALHYRGGLLIGTPANDGTFTFRVTVTDSEGTVVQSNLVTIIVVDSGTNYPIVSVVKRVAG